MKLVHAPPSEGFLNDSKHMPQQHMDGLFRDANVAYKQSKQSTFTNLNEVRIIKSYIYRSKSSIAYYCSRIEEYLDFNKEPIGLCI